MMESGHFQYNHVHALLFSLEKIHRNEKKIKQRFIMEDVDIFSPFGSHSEYVAQFFNVNIWSDAIQHFRRHHLF